MHVAVRPQKFIEETEAGRHQVVTDQQNCYVNIGFSMQCLTSPLPHSLAPKPLAFSLVTEALVSAAIAVLLAACSASSLAPYRGEGKHKQQENVTYRHN